MTSRPLLLLFLLALATNGFNSPAIASSAADFISTPPIPTTDVVGKKWVGSGVLQIQYKDGTIADIRILENSGNSELNRAAIRHVQRNYRVRPGASGSVRLPFQLNGDFVKMPSFVIPYTLRKDIGIFKSETMAQVTYQAGRITQVALHQSSGNTQLNQLITRHIQKTYTVISGSSGTQELPVRVDFKSPDPAVPQIQQIGRVYEFRVPAPLRSQAANIKTQVLLDIYYQNHKITRIVVVQSCGSQAIDQAVVEDTKKHTTIAINGSGKNSSLVPIRL